MEWLDKVKENCLTFLLEGVESELWESVNETTLTPIPFPVVFNLETRELRVKQTHGWKLWKTIDILPTEKTLFSHLLAAAGFFESVGEAKRAGWNKPIVEGEFFFKNKTKRLKVVSE